MEHRRYVITDDPQLQFVLIEIKLGITFVQTALSAHYSGHDEHGDSAKANAIKALDQPRASSTFWTQRASRPRVPNCQSAGLELFQSSESWSGDHGHG
jgi:hypothetical protein